MKKLSQDEFAGLDPKYHKLIKFVVTYLKYEGKTDPQDFVTKFKQAIDNEDVDYFKQLAKSLDDIIKKL